MSDLATKGPEDLRHYAAWWLQFRANNLWQDFNVQVIASQEPALGTGIKLPPPAADKGEGTRSEQPTIQDIAKLTGNPARGRKLFHERATCVTCHAFAGKGGSVGPDLTTIGAKFGAPALLDALLNPSANITFGYEATIVTLKNGESVTGYVVGAGDPMLVTDLATGRQRAIKASDTASTEQLKTSLMPSATGLGLKNQDLADLMEFLLTEGKSTSPAPGPDGTGKPRTTKKP
jgi:putative heme-binding domain-containing protein